MLPRAPDAHIQELLMFCVSKFQTLVMFLFLAMLLYYVMKANLMTRRKHRQEPCDVFFTVLKNFLMRRTYPPLVLISDEQWLFSRMAKMLSQLVDFVE